MKLRGKVVKGAGRGKALGFPTANLDAVSDIEEGIYAGYSVLHPSTRSSGLRVASSGAEMATSSGQKFASLVFVGAAETFGESEKKVEVYILDFSGDLYGRELEVEIVKKLRDNQKFDSAEALTSQMRRDELEARACLA